MNIHDLLFGSDTFFCIFCNRHRHISDKIFSEKGIGVCSECHNKIKPYQIAPIPTETEFCKTVISVLPYTGAVRQALGNYKFKNKPIYAKVFSFYIISFIEILNDSLPVRFTDYFDLITAVPISGKRFRERGYNQSELIAREFSERFEIPTNFDAVKKIKDTKAQSRLSRSKRSDNVINVYEADENIVKGKRILLFDDVFTTGSTVNSCAGALRKAGAENISCITISNRLVYTHSPDYYNYIR